MLLGSAAQSMQTPSLKYKLYMLHTLRYCNFVKCFHLLSNEVLEQHKHKNVLLYLKFIGLQFCQSQLVFFQCTQLQDVLQRTRYAQVGNRLLIVHKGTTGHVISLVIILQKQ